MTFPKSKTTKCILLLFLLILPPFTVPVVSYYDGNYCPVYDVSLNATVCDIDNDLMNVSFYWGNYEKGNYESIVGFCNVPSGTNISASLPEYWHRQINVGMVTYNITWLEHNHHYEWFVLVDDGNHTVVLQSQFDTCKAWDLNLDKKIDYVDLSIIVSHYAESMIPGAQPWDINEDSHTNYLDVSALVNHYGE